MTDDITLNLLAIAFLILANALFVAAEFALVRVRRTRMEELVSQGNASAKIVREAIDHINDYISAAQVGITAASLALGAIAEPFFAHGIERVLRRLGPSAPPEAFVHAVAIVAVVMALFLLTFAHVVAGEQLPKVVALQFPEKSALYLVRPMRWFMKVFWPAVWLLNTATMKAARLFGLKPALPHAGALSEEELLMLVAESRKAGLLSEEEQRMLQQVFKFYSKTVRQIMIPRPDIVALDLRADAEQMQAAFRQGYSRLPVYDGSLNNIKGIVYMKDLIYTLQDPKLIKLVDLLREAVYVPESKGVAALLHELQRNRMHMAIVVDEFGDTAGLVTMEDIVEEIVGEIQDEYDYEPAQVEHTPDGSVAFDGKVSLDRFREVYADYLMPEGTFETVAGLVLGVAGRVPREGDVVRHGGLVFKVTKRDGRRLRRISVRRETSVTATSTPEGKTPAPDPPVAPPAAGAAKPAGGSAFGAERGAVHETGQRGDQPPPASGGAGS
ncbi:MAG: hemolysin family protein [Planctomycetota bacterium]|nr:hemolysin family protein [Planctomycetota bacterium]